MDDYQKALINDLYVAQVLCLAKQMKAEKLAKGIHSTSDFIYDAVQEIHDYRREVFQVRSQMQ